MDAPEALVCVAAAAETRPSTETVSLFQQKSMHMKGTLGREYADNTHCRKRQAKAEHLCRQCDVAKFCEVGNFLGE